MENVFNAFKMMLGFIFIGFMVSTFALPALGLGGLFFASYAWDTRPGQEQRVAARQAEQQRVEQARVKPPEELVRNAVQGASRARLYRIERGMMRADAELVNPTQTPVLIEAAYCRALWHSGRDGEEITPNADRLAIRLQPGQRITMTLNMVELKLYPPPPFGTTVPLDQRCHFTIKVLTNAAPVGTGANPIPMSANGFRVQ